MSRKNCWRAAAALTGLLSAATSSVTFAKPPDLPVEQDYTCRGSEVPVTLDVVMPALLPPLLAVQMHGAETPAESEEAQRAEAARHVFQVGERCRSQGNLDMARTCYEEAHLLSPTSRPGRLAIQRLHELEQDRGGAEEQEEPPLPPRRTPTTEEPPLQQRGPVKPEQMYEEMRRNSQPLGLVERSY